MQEADRTDHRALQQDMVAAKGPSSEADAAQLSMVVAAASRQRVQALP